MKEEHSDIQKESPDSRRVPHTDTSVETDAPDLVRVGGAYPNPATTFVSLPVEAFRRSGVVSETFILYDVLGRQLIGTPATWTEQGLRLAVAHLSPGVYFCHITAGDKTSVHSFVIQR